MRLVHPAWALLAAFAAGCSSSGNSSQASSSTLAGTVSGASALRVQVVGASNSASTDSSGAFTLSNVAAGATALRFTGSGVDATLSIAAVIPSEYRELVVKVSGNSASEQLDRSSTEFSGQITGLAGSLGSAAIAVAGRNIKVSNNTFVTDGESTLSLGELIGGETVTVEGAFQADGSLVARTIELGDNDLTLTDGGCAMNGGPHDGPHDGGPQKGDDGGAAGAGGGQGDGDGHGGNGGGHGDPGGGNGGEGGHDGPGGGGMADGGVCGPDGGMGGGHDDDGGTKGDCGHRPHGGGPGLAHVMGAIVSIDATSESFVVGTTTVDTNSATIYGGSLTFTTLIVGESVAVAGVIQSDGTLLAAGVQDAP